jgi:hypothetical protein
MVLSNGTVQQRLTRLCDQTRESVIMEPAITEPVMKNPRFKQGFTNEGNRRWFYQMKQFSSALQDFVIKQGN